MANEWYNNVLGSGVNIFGAGGNGNTDQMIELGLLAPDAKSKAQSQSLMRGLLGAGIGYLAQPQNQNYGSATPYIAKALQQGMVQAQQPFDQLGKSATQNMQLQKYKDAKESKENYKEFGKGLGLKANNDNMTVRYKNQLNSKLIDEDGNQIAPSMLDSNFSNEVQEKQMAFFNKQKYLDDALAQGMITPEQYEAHKPDAPDYMAVGDRVFNKSEGKFVDNGSGLNLTVGEKKVDENYATQYFEYINKSADVDKQIDQLGLALNTLQTTKDGSISGRRVAALDSAGKLAYVDPEAQAVYDQVTEVVQRNLKLILGGQFSEKEGERLIARAYNPALGQEENARRVKALMTQIKSANEAQAQMAGYFGNYGTLKGFKVDQKEIADSLYSLFPDSDVEIQEADEGSNNDQLNAILNKYE